MLIGMIDAVRGCLKEEIRMDVISNNIANSNVIGFKKSRISFQDLLNESLTPSPEAQASESEDTALVTIITDQSPGDSRFTGNPLDFSISGEGFFKVETSDGVRYTRQGNFKLDENGFLTSQSGHRVLGTDGTIQISGSEITVDKKGNIEVDGAGIGQFAVVSFDDPDACIHEGAGLFINVSDSAERSAPSETQIQQQYIELSNVNVSEEIVNMIHSVRAFESYKKAIEVLDGINNKVINDVGS